MTMKKSRILTPMLVCAGLIASAAAAQSGSGTRTLTAVLSPPDSTCNHTLEPHFFSVAPREEVEVDIIVPNDTEIVGWWCDGTVCSKTFITAKPMIEVLVINNGDPNTLGGAKLAIEPTTAGSPPRIWVPCCSIDIVTCPLTPKSLCPVIAAPTCCSCPCDFATCD